MRIINADDEPISLDNLAGIPARSLYYGVLDYRDADFHFEPLLFTEAPREAIAHVALMGHRVALPASWSILCLHGADIEPIRLRRALQCPFTALVLNPRSTGLPEAPSMGIEIEPSMKPMIVPRLSRHHALAVPLHGRKGAPCIYITPDAHELPTLDLSTIMA